MITFEEKLKKYLEPKIISYRKDLLSSLAEEFEDLLTSLDFNPDSVIYDIKEGSVKAYFYYEDFIFELWDKKGLNWENKICTIRYDLIVKSKLCDSKEDYLYSNPVENLEYFLQSEFLPLAAKLVLK